MAQTIFRCLGLVVLGIAFAATSAMAGSTGAKHGVRVHKLMTPQDQDSETQSTHVGEHTSVAPHSHVIVDLDEDAGRSEYRRRYPGVERPWQDRRYGRKHRRWLNPKGLYTSKIYRRGYY